MQVEPKILTGHEIQVGHFTDHRWCCADILRCGATVGCLALSLDRLSLSLKVGVLARVEVEELGVCEESQILLHVERLFNGGGIGRADGVEVAEVLRHVGTVSAVVSRHGSSRQEAKGEVIVAD